jgi:formamidopyrimidine-DNA glycosylase
MPELPEVETVRRGLEGRILGARIERAEVRRSDLRIPVPRGFARRVEGRRVQSLGRRAKYLLLHLDDGQVLIVHLGMSGRLVVGEPGEVGALPKHAHVVLAFDNGRRVVFEDHRRFGLMTLAADSALEGHRLFRHLGPEPLGEAFDGPSLAGLLAGSRAPLKAALLDQTRIVGVGNIYASEALHRAGLSPKRVARTVAGTRAARLAMAVRETLADAIKAGGSSLRDYVQASGELGYFQHAWRVYDREGDKCPTSGCKGRIRRIVQSNRSTFYCPACQR